MTVKYQVTSQLTGLPHETTSFEEAQQLQTQLRNEYLATIEQCFAITALVEIEDGSIMQVAVDENGNPKLEDWMINP